MSYVSNATRIKVWVIEDDTAYRETLAHLLEHTPDMQCTQVFPDCEDALAWLSADPALIREIGLPNVVLLDINMPGINGLECLNLLKTRMPLAKIIMLTIRDEAETIYEAFRSGASGYLLKNAGVDRILTAVRETHLGGTLMPKGVARKVLAYFQENVSTPDYGLTDREKEVLQSMAEGLSQKMIADKLFVSRHTVNTHIQHIYVKLHVHSGIEAVAKAFREGLL